MNLDTTFIAQVITIIGFVVGLSVFVASGRYPVHIRRSLRDYSYGKFLLAAAFLVAGLRAGRMPELFVPLANGLGIAGLILNYTSIRHLQQRPVWPHWPVFVGTVVALCCLLALLAGGNDLTPVRTLSSLVAAGVLAVISFEVLVRYRDRGIPHYVTGVMSLTLAGAYLVRMTTALLHGGLPVEQMADDRVERITFILSFLGTVIGAINYVLMASDEFNRELTKLAHTDGLTGVLNRRRLFELGEIEFRRARRHGRSLTVLILDIDRFKSINDRAGHPFGDRVIQAVADCCAGQIRHEDIIGRMGGEEFALLLPETGTEAGALLAERLRAAIERELEPLGAERGVGVTCSVGGAALTAGQREFSDLIAQADAALYDAKNGGRNMVCFAGTVLWQPAAVPA